MADRKRPIWVGRDGVTVDDPFAVYRNGFDPAHAATIDEEATKLADFYGNLSQKDLEKELEDVGRPLETLDLRRASQARLFIEIRETLEAEMMRIEEEALLEGSMTAADSSVDRIREAMPHNYLEDWYARQGAAAERWVAIRREQALREEGKERPELDPTEVNDLGAENAGRDADQKTPLDRDTRNSVKIEPTLDRLRTSIGKERLVKLKEREAPLAEWARQRDTDWLRSRVEELRPALGKIDAGAAAAALRVEAARDGAIKARARSRAPAREFAGKNPEREAAATRDAKKIGEEIEELDGQLKEHWDKGTHPDAYLAGKEDALVAYGAFRDELQVRRRAEIETAVDAAVREPSAQITAVLGESPDGKGSKGRAAKQAWEDAVRALETDRIEREVAARDGVEQQPDAAQAQAAFRAEVIDHYLEQTGRQPAQEAAGVDLA